MPASPRRADGTPARPPGRGAQALRAAWPQLGALVVLGATAFAANADDTLVPAPREDDAAPAALELAPAAADDDDADAGPLEEDEPRAIVDDGNVAAPLDETDTAPAPLVDDAAAPLPPDPTAAATLDDEAVTDDTAAAALELEAKSLDAPPPPPPAVVLVPPPAKRIAPTVAWTLAPGLFFDPTVGAGVIVRGGARVARAGFGALVVDGAARATQSLHQQHALALALDRPLGSPLFVVGRAGLVVSNALPYCGAATDCTAAAASDALLDAGVPLEELPRRVPFVYRERVIAPSLAVAVGWHLLDEGLAVDVEAGWRVDGFVDGELADTDGDRAPNLAPFADSVRAHEPTAGVPMLGHGPRLGLAVARLDDEARPTRGFRARAMGRAASRAWGAGYDVVGVGAALAAYLPVGPRWLGVASRTLVDVAAGDTPPLARARLELDEDLLWFGGADVGRGLPLARHRGLVKLAEQLELRATADVETVFGLPMTLGAVGFVDVAYVAPDLARARLDPALLHAGLGVGARLGVGDLVFRADLAVSPDDGFRPSPYLGVGHTF